MSANDQTLLQQWVRDRDAEAFRTLAMRHAAMVYNTSRRILRDPTDAEDVAQECFEALVRAGDKPGAYLGAWLHRVATNLSCSRIESKQRRIAREDRFAASATPAAEPCDQDLYTHIDEAIAALPDKLRTTYPANVRVPYAMLSQAVCQAKLGHTARANELLQDVIRNFPTTPAADQANAELKKLKSK